MENNESDSSAWEEIFGSTGDGKIKFATADTYLDAYRANREEKTGRKFLAFFLGTEEYAADLRSIKEILKYQVPTYVPRTRPFLLGVISVRGEVLPVLDLKRKTGMGETRITNKTRILVVERDNERFGLTVDEISSVEVLPPSSIQPPPVSSGREKEFVEGIGRIGERLLILISMAEILDFGDCSESEVQ